MGRAVILVGTVLVVALTPSANAATSAPPGNSGVDQYAETLPSSGGSVPSEPGGAKGQGGQSGSDGERNQSAPSPVPERVLPPVPERALPRAGADGAEGPAPQGKGAARKGSRGKNRSGDAEGGGSGLGNAVDQLAGGDSGGMGIALPIMMGFSLLAALFLFGLRRRGDDEAQWRRGPDSN